MGQRERNDYAGCWHHIFNRGITRRTVFECLTDVRYFLSRIAKARRMGLIEVHAYCFMLTHFHLLVRSPVGEVSHAMRVITNPFSRWFNRRRRRDGPLFRGRFRSRPVESEQYWWTLVRYIDFNPVTAGILADPAEFPYGSAACYAHPGPRPRWLTRNAVEAAVAGGAGGGTFEPARYRDAFGIPPTAAEIELVERRLEAPHLRDDPLDDLLGAAPESILDWQRRKCRLADGTGPGLPVVTPATVADLLDGSVATGPATPAEDRLLLATGMMRSACGLAFDDIGRRLGCSQSSAQRWAKAHAARMAEDASYAERAAGLLDQALRTDHAAGRVSRVW